MDFILPQIEFFENGTWLDEPIEQDTNLRYWHIIFMALGCFLSVVVMLCCCFRFRIPRTKQEIEADYQRRIIARKFREKLEKIKNTEMENMDLTRALERIQSEILLDQFDSPQDAKEDVKLIEDKVKHKRQAFHV